MNRWALFGVLFFTGGAWGVTLPLSKMAVEGGYRHVGLIFWQLVIGIVLLGAILVLTGRRVPITRTGLKTALIIAFIGTLIPNSTGYEAARYFPSGWLSILISTVPIFAFVIALLLKQDKFHWVRLAGLVLGFVGVVSLFIPWDALDEPFDFALLALLPLALVAPLLYGFEGNFVAKWGTGGLDPVQLLFLASVIGAIVVLPMTFLTGEWINPLPPYGRPDIALFLSSVIHTVTYVTYVWLVGKAGPVFASQVGYVVTISGISWAMILLDERYGWMFIVAIVLTLVGVFLVQPRRADA